MNTLEHYIRVENLCWIKTMNTLQNYGVISDECVEPRDVRDAGKAVAWLSMNMNKYE